MASNGEWSWEQFIEDSLKQNQPPAPSHVENDSSPQRGIDDDGRRYALAALRNECDTLATTPEGQRNHQLNISAFRVARFVPHLLAEEEVVDKLSAGASSAGLTHHEIAATIRSGLRGSQQKIGPKYPPPRTNGHTPNIEITAEPEPEPATSGGVPAILAAENGFWDSRESLHIIYKAALTRMCAPWAVLALCAARALTLVRPNVTLPALIGGRGSLNWFAAIAAQSGGGKGSASAVARELVTNYVRERNLGSGEGIIGAYHRPATRKDEPPETHEANMFTADEIDTVSALGARTGSTTMAVLRSAFSGETLGFSYIAKGRDIHLEAHSYRMCLVVSVQPDRAGSLLADHRGGTPQRFMWFPGTDQRISEKLAGEWIPGPLPVGELDGYPRELALPDQCRRFIIATRAKNARGEVDAIDGHAAFCREKFAYALTLLDSRTNMTDEDWELSGIAAEISNRTRQWVTTALAAAEEQVAEEKGRLAGVTQSASEDEKIHRAAQRTNRVARWVLEKLSDGPMSQRELSRAIASRDRGWLKGAVDALVRNELIVEDKQHRRWVKL